jgi:AcrR family transcriptional regulator
MIRLVGERGYSGVSIEMLCDRAAVKQRNFYCRFADREECFLSFHDEIAAQLRDRVATALETPSNWHDRIWAAGWAAMRFLREDPRRARFFFAETSGIDDEVQARRDRIVHAIAKLLDGGRAELEDPSAISAQTARIVAGIIYDTALAKVRGGWLERGEDFLPELIYMAVMPYLGITVAEDEFRVQTLRRR